MKHLRSRGPRAIAIHVVTVCAALVAGGCGASTNPLGITELPVDRRPAVASLGDGPWDSERVQTFVRPAYEALQDVEGQLLLLYCMPGAYTANLPDVDPDSVVTCMADYSGGGKGYRLFRFDKDGTVGAELDVTPDSERVNPGVHCSSGVQIDPTLPDCSSVQVERLTQRISDPDPSLYGTADGPVAREGQSGNPRECPGVNGSLVQAVRFSCEDAIKVAKHVTKDESCRPAIGSEEKTCTVLPLQCDELANGDPTRQWSVRCMTGDGKHEEDDEAYIRFYVPPPPRSARPESSEDARPDAETTTDDAEGGAEPASSMDGTDSSTASASPPPQEPTDRSRLEFEAYVGNGFEASLPSSGGWSSPTDSQPTPGALYRIRLRGPSRSFLLIDYTPHEPATFGGSYRSSQALTHPMYGRAVEYTFTGGLVAGCARFRCVDIVVNDADADRGFGVLAGGPSLRSSRAIVRRVMRSLRFAG